MIIDGKAVAEEIRNHLAEEVKILKQQYNFTPGLAIVMVGNDPASKVYTTSKLKAAEAIGINAKRHELAEDVEAVELKELIHQLNSDEKVHGIIVQLPLPSHLNEQDILREISTEKDVDGLHPLNLGRLVAGTAIFAPCTAQGVIALIEKTGVELTGKNAVVVGRSEIVGKPTAFLLLAKNATVTICHSRTANLAEETRRADILVSAVGKPKIITADMVKPGAVVIDVGISRGDEGITGDVDFDKASKVAGAITPVPGGVGPMTVAMLMKNTVLAAKKHCMVGVT